MSCPRISPLSRKPENEIDVAEFANSDVFILLRQKNLSDLVCGFSLQRTYEHLRTIYGYTHDTFLKAAQTLGLLHDDQLLDFETQRACHTDSTNIDVYLKAQMLC
ncbi:unnamed protein product [Strongylus vulgaris]|uniref:Uncharacterized protein n=1 Tax=Strongylus vulgaris TaxID=40348 RepID=A0A3P7L511_STRVU|nr:unnamed protein product [Strongylus vulgaris]